MSELKLDLLQGTLDVVVLQTLSSLGAMHGYEIGRRIELDEGMSAHTVQVSAFLELRRQNASYADMAAYFAFYGVGDSVLNIDGATERMNVVPVSQNFFPL